MPEWTVSNILIKICTFNKLILCCHLLRQFFQNCLSVAKWFGSMCSTGCRQKYYNISDDKVHLVAFKELCITNLLKLLDLNRFSQTHRKWKFNWRWHRFFAICFRRQSVVYNLIRHQYASLYPWGNVRLLSKINIIVKIVNVQISYFIILFIKFGSILSSSTCNKSI